MKNTTKNIGAGLVEVVVGVSLILVTLVGLVSAYNLFLKAALKNTEIVQANFLIEEGLEVVRVIRDSGWTSNITPLSQGTEYDVVNDAGEWKATTSISLIDGKFYRVVNIFDVLRDGNDDISISGTPDPNTKLFTVTVSWLEGNATSSRSLSTYLTKIF